MTYLLKRNIQENVAAFLLTLMFTETFLPLHLTAKTGFAGTRITNTYTPVLLTKDKVRVTGAGTPLNTTHIAAEKKVEDIPMPGVNQENNTQQPFIGGPGQPEMSSFKSVNNDNMVDLFTGDFSYNIPLLDVGGYPVNIHYNGGATIDHEASWVGLGWNVNPGVISRSTRGLPDDFNGDDKIIRIQKIKENKTIGVNVGGNIEIFGGVLNLSINGGVFSNTYNGWGVEYGVNANISSGSGSKGSLTGSLGLQNNSQSGLSVTPGLSVNLAEKGNIFQGSTGIAANYNSRTGLSGLQFNAQVSGTVNASNLKDSKKDYSTTTISGPTSFISFATPAYTPSIKMPFTSTNYSFNAKYGGEAWGVFGNLNITGYVSKQEIADEDTLQSLPAYGFLYYTKAKDSAQALLDLSREKEIYFNAKSTPHVAIPQYTYDVYSISGEGTGGMFRPYRSEAGYIRDHYMQTKSKSGNFAINLGGGAWFKGGLDVNETIATTKNSAWKTTVNSNLEFKDADTTFQPVYFRNPGEKTSNTTDYYQSVGGDSTIRIKLTGSDNNVSATNAFVAYSNKLKAGEISINGPVVKKNRDKRTQVITYRTSEEAAGNALDKKIYSYYENAIPLGDCPETAVEDTIERKDDIVRKGHHISEITVLNGDGRRYIYGLPAYNVEQSDVTFSVDKEVEQSKIDKGMADYEAEKDNHAGTNKKGKENFFTKDITPAHAHSFLLTALVSPDYVDVTGDGVSDDDLGDAVKFNYTRIYGKKKNTQYYKWRTPNEQNMVNYDEGLKTYSRDDKGTYLFGEKEVWYLNSIASKTMIAVFRISDKREDNLGVKGENGGVDPAQKMRRLERIDLYSKPDLIQNGVNARPVKSVHFEYDYSLCRNTPNNSGNPVDKSGNAVAEGSSDNVNKNKGKLTLRKIWFSYNGNYKGIKNPYKFNYGQVESGQPENKYNPEHNSKHYDRWGSYKHPSGNPSSLNNVDYPYAVQDSANATEYSNAWQLTDIKLPSGGIMKISYEADDYAYVQNRRAMQLFTIAGFGSTSSSTPEQKMYMSNTDRTEYEYVFIDVSKSVTDKADIYRKYLQGVEKLYFRLAVQMPEDVWGKGFDMVPTYVNIDQDNYGVVPGNDKRIWIKLAQVDGKQPLLLAALQFMKLNIPAKAYPASETGEGLSFESAVRMLVTSLSEIQNVVKGFYDMGKKHFWCQQVVVSKSFVRLNVPSYKKYGGGYRVKRVETFDNWNAMTTRKEASYGQRYSYTTTEVITKQTLISGVRKLVKDTIEISSGVASYEPFIGGEENPFREPVEYEERMSVLAPKNYLYSEKPLGESFFGAPMVGYSKVRVRTIHSKAKSANGWQESEFYTTRDFPTLVDFTSFDGESKRRYNPKLRSLLNLNAISNVTLSQGFKVELNDMNGKLKSQSGFAETDSLHPFQYTKNYYRVDDENAVSQHLNNNVWIVDSLNGNVNKNAVIGLDIEIMNDLREQYSKTISKSAQTNIDIIPLLAWPLVIGTLIPYKHKEENTFRSATTVKIVQRYGILDSVVVMDKGSIVSTKNMVYDGETGDPVLTRTNNEFDDPVYQFNYPAYWAYSGMGPAYKNIDAVFKSKRVIKGKMENSDGSAFDAKRFFESGDEILISECRMTETIISSPGDCPQYRFSGSAKNVRIWAIDAAKGKEKDRGLYFIDENGKPFHGAIESMRIIRSGKRNMVSASAGSIVSLANPMREITTGKFKIVIDSNTQVINTAATAYKDLWQVEKTFYVKDSVVRVYRDFDPISVSPKVSVVRFDSENNSEIFSNKGFAITSLDYIRYRNAPCHHHSRTVYSKSILEFNLDDIPSDAIITSAYISFYPKVPNSIWGRVSRQGRCFFDKLWSYDWSTATSFYKDAANASIERITNKWTTQTHYRDFQQSPDHKVAVTSSDYNNILCTALIQDYIQNPRFGLMLQLDKRNPDNNSQSESNYISFCQANQNNMSSVYCSNSSGEALKTLAIGGCNCYAPTLQINYKAYVDSTIKLCKENINDTATNPYRWGILGNWRADKAYTYYSDRKESDASITATDIRKEGVLKQFTVYWNFSDSGLVNVADTNKWVWNAAVSMYNKRGFEIENYDPLGRYNAGLYGYNQTMPVAVAQNSRYREILYDGFEDYDYRNQACIPLCENPREFDFRGTQTGVTVDNTQSHTGRYSIKVNSGYSSTLTAPVSAPDTLSTAVSINIDSTPIYNATRVIGAGTGFTGIYSQDAYEAAMFGCSYTSTYETHTEATPDMSGIAPPIVGLCRDASYEVTWQAKLQAKTTDTYTFHLTGIGGRALVTLNAVPIAQAYKDTRSSAGIPLVAGQLYYLEVKYVHTPYEAFGLKLEWQANSLNADGAKEVIPTSFLYPPSTSTAPSGSFEYNISRYCIEQKNVKPEQVIRPVFRPVTKTKIVVSAWMKIGGDDCLTAPVLTDALKVVWKQNASTLQTDFPEKTGQRIEGWQRYEKIIIIPESATQVQVVMTGTQGKNIYVDDVRIQPYNSSMKAFAYDAVSLRLMAELDENNYASFYEYDDDGTLIRVKKETVKGIQTIKETRSALIREE
ncbi:MAG: PA14 domain-containing protein [Agriterribacter sp.]